ncbi:MAG: DNA ligase [Verrucomicrobia bacterium]|nr:MAG: DNA ligase [Verrucomicrobiota bacterium]
MAFQFHHGGVYFPKLALWLDPHEPQNGVERVFVSHAHSDHIGEHREVILSPPTAAFMQARLGGARQEHVLPFGEPAAIETQGIRWQITLLPAGHIFGSAMSWIEAEGESVLYTGDFKLRPGLSAEPCEPRHADTLIMETTYGRPEYQFPPTREVLKGVVRFCREAIDNEETPVLLGYSLGKSQELLRGLADAGLAILLHESVFKLTKIFEQLGHRFPPHEKFEGKPASGKVLICPPMSNLSAALRKLGKARAAVLTGWAVDPDCCFRYQTDAAFPLSDHADFPDLVEFVKRVAPKRVFTLHGFAADFAQTLREMGFAAQALSEEEQLALPLTADSGGRRTETEKIEIRSPNPEISRSLRASIPAPREAAFSAFAETCAAIGAVSGKLEKVRWLAGYLAALADEPLVRAASWFTGYPFPPSQNKVLQLGGALISDALCAVGGVTPTELRQIYLKHSDGGETAFEILSRNPVTTARLSVGSIQRLFEQVHGARGPSAKLPLLIQALRQCTPLEGKFLIKIFTGDLRIGLKEGLVEEAIARAFALSLEEVKRANLLLGDIGETARLAQQRRLASASIVPFRPVKFMLASPEETAADIWQRMKSRTDVSRDSDRQEKPGDSTARADQDRDRRDACPTRVWLEDKYDGIRCQVHKVGQRVALYSRDLKDITGTFFDIADAARQLGGDMILDGEILAMRGAQVLPFAELQKRLGRRDGDLFLGEEIPVRFIAFDLLWRDGKSFLDEPLFARRQTLESLAPLPGAFGLARIMQAGSAEEIEAAFSAARARDNEGLMIKDPNSVYSPGRRGLAWLKLKKALATLDCVVVGAEYGHGKRRNVLSDYTFAVRDDASGELKTIGKAYSGLTDAEIAGLTRHFLGKTIRQRGRYHEVEPDTVLEIAFDSVHRSDRHTSGLAMRFPRIARVRADKSPTEIDTISAARKWVKE